ncbi:hypothetical protein [Bradyrhizobium erythrophlei]|uniref:Uncharacterized protein n=1 Tax=Bradyrhizobium erythrophlei TaxID=1437360 RepID=A0A1M5R3N7_9BRAD|nr:hypothetical protein [Bradyrhizobium erythrophlei]SHH20768.1 hypothetical protein SAMN05444169_6318 [Bradyrhizobium erythrophlei]
MNDISSEDDGFDEDFDEAGVRDELTHKMRTEGALIAYRTAVKICRDPKATAAAKASAVNSLFRAGGFFANQESGDREKDLSEMTPAELKAALRKAETSLKSRKDEISKPKGGLFD